MRTNPALALVLSLCSFTQAQNPPAQQGPLELQSALHRDLYALPDSDGAIAAATQKLAADLNNIDLRLKVSKLQAAKRQYLEAIATCTAGLKIAPDNADLYVERGHRELGLRKFKEAFTDLRKATELASQNLDAHYHLGLANYFLGDFPKAAQSFQQSLDLSKNADSVIDSSNWLYVSLRRAGDKAAAEKVLTRITPDMKNEGPHLYFYLRLLRFYQGKLQESELLPRKPVGPADVEGELSFNTVSYGLGNWHLYNHDPARASELFHGVVAGSAWNSWGFVGAEVELTKGAH